MERKERKQEKSKRKKRRKKEKSRRKIDMKKEKEKEIFVIGVVNIFLLFSLFSLYFSSRVQSTCSLQFLQHSVMQDVALLLAHYCWSICRETNPYLYKCALIKNQNCFEWVFFFSYYFRDELERTILSRIQNIYLTNRIFQDIFNV